MSRLIKLPSDKTLTDFERDCDVFATYIGANSRGASSMAFVVMGLSEISGAIAREFKTAWTVDQLGTQGACLSIERRQRIKKLIGELVFYASRMSAETGLLLADVADEFLADQAEYFEKRAANEDAKAKEIVRLWKVRQSK